MSTHDDSQYSIQFEVCYTGSVYKLFFIVHGVEDCIGEYLTEQEAHHAYLEAIKELNDTGTLFIR